MMENFIFVLRLTFLIKKFYKKFHMSESTMGKVLYYVSIIIGFRFNILFRQKINKYTLQNLFKLTPLSANRVKHMNDVIDGFGRIFATYFGDFVFGNYKTILLLIPIAMAIGILNISSIFLPKSSRGFWYSVSFSILSSVNFAHMVLIIPFIKYQLQTTEHFNRFFNIYYWILNIFHALSTVFQTIIFKTHGEANGYTESMILKFWIPPFIITVLFFCIFYLLRNSYKIEIFMKKMFTKYFKDFIYSNKELSLIDNELKSSKLKIVATLIGMKILWHIVEDQFETCITDFADSAKGFKFSLGSEKWIVSGSTLEAFNPLTVVIFSPILVHLIYPYILYNWSDFRRLTFGYMIAQAGLLMGALFHTLNTQKKCIDSSTSLSLLWYILCVMMGAMSELIIYPIYIQTISFNTPAGYDNLCMCIALSSRSGGSLICYLMNLTPLSEIVRLCILVCISALGPVLIYAAYKQHKATLKVIEKAKAYNS